jgi:hypothetical protein
MLKWLDVSGFIRIITSMAIAVCSNCNNKFERDSKHYNEAIKKGWKQFCSKKCLSIKRMTGKSLVCSNLSCGKTFYRKNNEISIQNFCSSSCAAHINNRLKQGKHYSNFRNYRDKKCEYIYCSNLTARNSKFCSHKCAGLAIKIPNEEYKINIINKIREFYSENDRIPYKNELNKVYSGARRVFGSWNNAIIAAGYDPNPVKFAKKYVAKDGHKCDSLAEKLIDDWLSEKGIDHEVHVPYPGQKRFKSDFLIGKTWIEYFGIYGEFEIYTELANEKIKLAESLKLDFIKIFPQDLFPLDNLAYKLCMIPV